MKGFFLHFFDLYLMEGRDKTSFSIYSVGHDNVVNLLLEAGVNVNLRNNKGQTALMLAASCGNEGVGYFLLQVSIS